MTALVAASWSDLAPSIVILAIAALVVWAGRDRP